MHVSKPQTPIINWGNPLTQSILSCYPFFSTSGTLLKDVGPNRFDGTIVATPPWKGSPYGIEANFDGSTQYINAGTYGNLGQNMGNSFTLVTWLKTTATTTQTICGTANTGSTTLFQFQINLDGDGLSSNGKINFQYRNETNTKSFRKATTSATSPSFNDGNWHMIAYVIDPPNLGCAIYIDGISQPTSGNLGDVMSGSANFSFPLLIMGRSNRATPDTFLAGDMAQLIMWSRLLTATEIRSLYKSPFQIYQQNNFQNYYIPSPATTAFASSMMMMGMGS